MPAKVVLAPKRALEPISAELTVKVEVMAGVATTAQYSLALNVPVVPSLLPPVLPLVA